MRTRPSVDEYFLAMAYIVASRSTCRRRAVGCILVDHRTHILATGYNGVAHGVEHCLDIACPGAHLPSGTGLDKCQAIHAEANALLQCSDVWKIHTVYCTTAPCVHCIKLLQNTSAQHIVTNADYPQSAETSRLWTYSRIGRTWRRVDLYFDIADMDKVGL